MNKKKIKAKMYKGMPTPVVELTDEQAARATGGAIEVSLLSINDALRDQSYGLVRGSTGCYNNPGGPTC